MLSHADATALVLGSRLFDEEWYGGLVDEAFASREAAVAHWVAQAAPDASPHPLFEPAWLYPGGRWLRHAPDPLSFYLSRPEARGRSPHPLYDATTLGPLEGWLADHEPAEVLTTTRPALDDAFAWVEVPTGDLGLAVRWLRHLDRRSPEVLAVVRTHDDVARRVLGAVAAALPGAVLADQLWGDVVVTVDAGVEPPRWPWLPALLAALDAPGVAAAQPLLLGSDLTVAAPVLVGHPVSAVERLDGAVLPERFPGVEAVRTGVEGTRVLATSSWVPGPRWEGEGPTWAPLREAATRVSVVEGVPSLRWSLDVAAGAAPIGRGWGDWYFARSLADALERRGQWVEIDHPETRSRATRADTDVVLTIRGLERVVPPSHTTNLARVDLLWVISHPDDVDAAELASYDVAFAASLPWARAHGVTPLLQCTDATRFRPGPGSPGDAGPEALFVGNARGGMRPVVAAALEAGVPLRVIGRDWAALGVRAETERIANTDLPAAYATAAVVLNDHHDDMRRAGFVSNRVFDVLAVGGNLLTDDVAGLREVVGVDLPTWRTPADLTSYDVLDAATRLALAERVVAEHSFDARAATLLDAALLQRRPSQL